MEVKIISSKFVVVRCLCFFFTCCSGLGNAYNIEGKEEAGSLEAALLAGDRSSSRKRKTSPVTVQLTEEEEYTQRILFSAVLSDYSSDSEGELAIEGLTINDDLGDDEGDEEYIDEGDTDSDDGEDEGDEESDAEESGDYDT